MAFSGRAAPARRWSDAAPGGAGERTPATDNGSSGRHVEEVAWRLGPMAAVWFGGPTCGGVKRGSQCSGGRDVDGSSSLVAAKVSSRPVRSGELGAAQRGNKGNDAQTLTERKGRRERSGRAIERRGHMVRGAAAARSRSSARA
jgi:hypothetical protein